MHAHGRLDKTYEMATVRTDIKSTAEMYGTTQSLTLVNCQ